ncbi:MAG TPA: GTPase domain-containing protein, partial [Kofleriaceae bacterium]
MISVVYDGPPQAGKTTSVRALARSFGREVYTPEERNGRTVHFDWMEHVGGRFDGSPIHCQVVSVPGQKRWTRRRAHFLDRADVVVFVGDTTAEGWPETVARLAALRADLDGRDGPPVGLVFQANKRDCADAVAFDEVKARAASARTAVVESSAADGTGVREAFVFAVRLALDRVREDHQRGRSTRGRTGFGDARGSELLDLVRGLDGDGERAAPS